MVRIWVTGGAPPCGNTPWFSPFTARLSVRRGLLVTAELRGGRGGAVRGERGLDGELVDWQFFFGDFYGKCYGKCCLNGDFMGFK